MDSLNFALIVVAALLDVLANILLAKSNGFKLIRFGMPALFFVCVSYTILAQVSKVMDLSVAYVSWGGIAILGTTLSGYMFLNQKLSPIGWLGMVTVICSIFILNI